MGRLALRLVVRSLLLFVWGGAGLIGLVFLLAHPANADGLPTNAISHGVPAMPATIRGVAPVVPMPAVPAAINGSLSASVVGPTRSVALGASAGVAARVEPPCGPRVARLPTQPAPAATPTGVTPPLKTSTAHLPEPNDGARHGRRQPAIAAVASGPGDGHRRLSPGGGARWRGSRESIVTASSASPAGGKVFSSRQSFAATHLNRGPVDVPSNGSSGPAQSPVSAAFLQTPPTAGTDTDGWSLPPRHLVLRNQHLDRPGTRPG